MAENRFILSEVTPGVIVSSTSIGSGSPDGTKYLRDDSTWVTPPSGGGVADGDKGDLTVTGGVWALDAGVVDTVELVDGAVTNAKAADMAQSTIKGRAAGAGTGDPTDLTAAQATAILDTFTSGAKGLVPASGGGTTTFLRADGSFAAPVGGLGDVVGPLLGATDNALPRYDTATGKLLQDSTVGLSDTGVLAPIATDTAALGSTTLQWSDLFLAEGGVINWDNGDATLTQSGDTVTLAGAGLVLPNGTTANAPLKLGVGGSLLTTPEVGAIEADANALYACTDAGNRGVVPVMYFIRCDGTRTLPNDTNENAIFNSPTNGRLTLETGCYFFDALMQVTSMSATSGNALIDWLGAGTATCAAWMWHYNALDNSTPTTGATNQAAIRVTQDSAASIATAGTGTGLNVWATGTFEVTVAGTFIPSIDLVTAAAGIVGVGSFFRCYRIGSTSVASVGQWD